MIKKFPFLLITLLLTLGLLLAGCASEATEEAPPPAEEEAAPPEEEAEAPAETGPVYVGALLPLSEPGAPQANQA